MWLFSGCSERGQPPVVVKAFLTVVPSLVGELGSRAQAQGLWHRGFVALRYADLPGPGIEPTSPALAGRFLFTGPPG